MYWTLKRNDDGSYYQSGRYIIKCVDKAWHLYLNHQYKGPFDRLWKAKSFADRLNKESK